MNYNVQVHPLREGPKPMGDGSKVELVAMANITVNDTLAIHNVRILRRVNDGTYFASMPQYKNGEEWKDVIHPITTEGAKELAEAVQAAAAAALA